MTGFTLLILFGAAAWLIELAWHPFAPCRRCEGRRGRNAGSKTRRWGHCGKCKGKGERARVGARTVRRAIGRPL